MALLLRKIQRGRWYRPDWLGPDDAPADGLWDLFTTQNVLSAWLVDDGRQNLERVVAAQASNRDHLAEFDYALVPEQSVREVGITIVETTGESPDEYANNTWHRDLIELSAGKVERLARLISKEDARKRVQPPQVKAWILRGRAAGRLSPEKMKESMLQDVES